RPAQAGARGWWLGLLLGTFAALILEPFVSLLPYGLGLPIEAHPHWIDLEAVRLTVLALVNGAIFAAVGALVRRLPFDDATFSRGLAAWCVAFALHGLIDLDLYMPGVMVGFAAALALLPGRMSATTPRASRTAAIVTGLWGFVCVLAPVVIVLVAETREH